jgi:hypothetical protein
MHLTAFGGWSASDERVTMKQHFLLLCAHSRSRSGVRRRQLSFTHIDGQCRGRPVPRKCRGALTAEALARPRRLPTGTWLRHTLSGAPRRLLALPVVMVSPRLSGASVTSVACGGHSLIGDLVLVESKEKASLSNSLDGDAHQEDKMMSHRFIIAACLFPTVACAGPVTVGGMNGFSVSSNGSGSR